MSLPIKNIKTKRTIQYVAILAGGIGSRMNSNVPKQLLDVGHDPMIVHLMKNCVKLNKEIILILSNKTIEPVLKCLVDERKYMTKLDNNLYKFMNINVHICVQPEPNGTGGAVMATKDFFKKIMDSEEQTELNDYQLLILSGDSPLVSCNTMRRMFDKLSNNDSPNVKGAILVNDTKDNYGYGRVIIDNNKFVKIVEQKDCNDDEKKITTVNTGVYAFSVRPLLESLQYLNTNNSQKEYYLTDCPKIIKEKINSLYEIDIVMIDNKVYNETMGANTPEQLEELRNEYKKKFSLYNLSTTDINISDDNLKELINVLGQLTNVGLYGDNDLQDLRTHIQSNKDTKQNKKHLIIMKYEDEIIGTGSILIEDKIIHKLGRVGHIEDIVIDESFRGHGLAKTVMEELIKIGKNEKCYKLILDASDKVSGFYEKIGFKKHAHNMRLDISTELTELTE